MAQTKPPTDTQRLDFLTLLAAGETVKDACDIARIPRRTVYYWREEDPEFAKAWKHAQEAWKDEVHEILKGNAEAVLKQRALDVNDKQGHLLLMFLLKKLDNSYRDNYKQEVTVNTTTGREFDFSKKDVAAAHKILEEITKEASDNNTDNDTHFSGE